MRGWDAKSDALFSYVSCEARVPKDHPLRPIRRHTGVMEDIRVIGKLTHLAA